MSEAAFETSEAVFEPSEAESTMPKPALDGIKVLDLSRVLAGPSCTMTLADLGAEVWKIEHPQSGDDTRSWRPPEAGGESTYYLSTNRNKRSVAIDLKSPAGQDIVRRLADKADVLTENMRRGTLERLGLGWDVLRQSNPRLIYCAISGYGRSGPRADDPGYDVLAQAESGLMSITGTPDSGPLKHGVAIVDLVTGLNATQAILAALVARQRTGQGQFIDIALLDSAVALLANVGSGYLNAGSTPKRGGNGHPTVVPYGTFEASDTIFVLGCGNDRQFRAICRDVIGQPQLADDPHYRRNQDRQQHRDALAALLTDIFRQKTAAHWIEALKAAGVPAGIVRNLGEVFAAPEVVERHLVNRAPHPTIGEVAMLASPLRLQGTPPRQPTAPPLLGQHTRAVLGDVLGFTPQELDRLVADHVVADLERGPARQI